MRESKITYYPTLSVKENARKNGVSEAAIRYYIKTNNLDRRYERKLNIIAKCRKYLKNHPKATREELHNKLGYGLTTIRQYWEYITTEKELMDFNSSKAKKRQLRQANDFYATHPSVAEDLLRVETFHNDILEPFCGIGSISEPLTKKGYSVLSYDLIDRGYGNVGDFFEVDYAKGEYDIITNPPYDNKLNDIIHRCLKLCKSKVAMLLPLDYLGGQNRYTEVYGKVPPARVYVYSNRIRLAKNGDFDKYEDKGASLNTYAWYIWEKGHKGTSELRWITNKSKVKERDVTHKNKIGNITILDGIPFNPFEEFHIPVGECIQFHSKALPENKVLSNHYDCIIRFRDCEFYSVEQLFLALTYSDSKKILRDIMSCTRGIKAKSLCKHNYENDRDWDFDEKQYRIIALCHLYKYLSVKEYRDRLRETYPQTLVECPNGRDYEFGLVQNLETNLFEGNNCSGRTTMIVRNMMLDLENNAIKKRETTLGRTLTNDEREETINEVCAEVRAKFDSDKIVLRDSRQLFKFIEEENIPKIKTRRPVPMSVPIIDRNHRCLVLDFDFTIFDTSVDNNYRKCSGKKDLNKAFELIPEYKLYSGWREVFDWCVKNSVKIGVISEASRKLIETAFAHFSIPYDVVIGWQQYIDKPNPILGNQLMSKLNIREEQIVYIGDSLMDDVQARCSKFRFYGAVWNDPDNEPFTSKGIPIIKHPMEIIKVLESIPIEA